MNVAEARDAVYLRTGYTSDDGQLTPERLNQILRSALNFIAAEHDWDWLQSTETLSTVASTNYVTPLAGSSVGVTWTRTTHLTGPSNDAMTRVPWDEFRRCPTTSTGQPDRWSDRFGRLYLWPVPDAVYALTHDFIRGEQILQTDSDTPLMPAQFQDGWVEYATYLASRRVGDQAGANAALNAYQDWMRVVTDNRHRSRGPFRVSVRPDPWL